MSISNVEHFATIVAGCESINNFNGTSLDDSGQYAFSVLKLHARDAGFVAGQEGFLDAVKKGAQTAKEFIKALIAAIRDWLKGISKDDRARITELERMIAKIEWKEFDSKSAIAPFTNNLMSILSEYKNIPKDALKFGGKTFDVDKLTTPLYDTAHAAQDGQGERFFKRLTLCYSLAKTLVEDFTATLESENNKLKEGEAVPKEVTEATQTLKKLTALSNKLVDILKRAGDGLSERYESFTAQNTSNARRERDLKEEKEKLEKGKKK